MQRPFRNRPEAGKRLAQALDRYRELPKLVVLALPRGGVPVGYEVALAFQVPLDVFVVRKLGVPGHEELAMGAIASGGVRIVNSEVVTSLGIPEDTITAVAASEQRELERRERLYRGDLPAQDVSGHNVILVDDGLATGSTMLAAVLSLRKQKPQSIIIGAPVAAADTCDAFRNKVDAIVCAETPEPFRSVGQWYEDFSQTTDEEVKLLLQRAALFLSNAA